MIETPHALIDAHGPTARALVEACRGRAVAVHLGAYDLTAELGVTAVDQRLDHPFCDFARLLLKTALAGLPVDVADGATTVLPIPPKNAPPDESAAAVHRAWSLHASNVRHALDLGIWQGWDLHPAQLPPRYGALYTYFLGRRSEMAARLSTF